MISSQTNEQAFESLIEKALEVVFHRVCPEPVPRTL